MHADGKSTLASVSKWNSGKVNVVNWEQNYNSFSAELDLFPLESSMKLGSQISLIVFCVNDNFTFALRFVRGH